MLVSLTSSLCIYSVDSLLTAVARHALEMGSTAQQGPSWKQMRNETSTMNKSVWSGFRDGPVVWCLEGQRGAEEGESAATSPSMFQGGQDWAGAGLEL